MSDLKFDAETHSYWLRGQRLPSVTQVIQRVMPYEGPRDEWAMQRGSAMHHGCALDDMGKLDWDSVSPEIEGRILAWRKFRRDWPAGLVQAEQPLASEKYRFAGTPDRVFDGGNGLNVLCDLKSNIVPQSIVQVGFYSLLLAENRIKIDRAVVVELRDDESFRCEWLDPLALRKAERVALACLTCHGFMAGHQLGERNVNSSR